VSRTVRALVAALLLSAAHAVGAQGSPTHVDSLTRAVASELRCPVCQGLSIQDSPSDLAQEMKALVHDQLAAGRTPQQVRQYFIDKYGEWILLEPKPAGFNLLVYLLPMAAVLGGGALVWTAVRRWTSTDSPGAPGA
jgi:cytochrome c-type biogenesis protein CcmH